MKVQQNAEKLTTEIVFIVIFDCCWCRREFSCTKRIEYIIFVLIAEAIAMNGRTGFVIQENCNDTMEARHAQLPRCQRFGTHSQHDIILQNFTVSQIVTFHFINTIFTYIGFGSAMPWNLFELDDKRQSTVWYEGGVCVCVRERRRKQTAHKKCSCKDEKTWELQKRKQENGAWDWDIVGDKRHERSEEDE